MKLMIFYYVIELNLSRVTFAIVLITLLTASCLSTSVNSSIRFNRLKMDDGLSSNKVTRIIQDNTGFIWIATRDGLNRFDGHTFRIFRPIPNNENSISSRAIRDIHQDRSGIIWIATDQGLNSFDPLTEQFQRYQYDEHDLTSLRENKVTSIAEDQQKNLWVGTRGGGLERFSLITKEFTHYQQDPLSKNSLSGNDVRDVLIDKNGELWIGTAKSGLNHFNPKTQTFRHFRHEPHNLNSLSQDSISKLYQDSKGMIWIGTYDSGLNQYDPVTNYFKHYQSMKNAPNKLGSNFVFSIHEDANEVIRVGTYNGGLASFNPTDNNFHRNVNDVGNPNSISDNFVRDIFQDKQGILWIATDNGVNWHDPRTKQFNHFLHVSNDLNSLGNNNVRTIYESSRNRLLVGTFGGMFQSNSDPALLAFSKTSIPWSKNIGTKLFQTFIEDSRGHFWIGTFASGLYQYNSDLDQLTNFQYDVSNPTSLSHTIVTSLIEDDQGVIWVGTLGGINRFDRKSGSFTRYQSGKNKPNGLSSNYISTLFQDKSGLLWIGHREEGVNSFDIKHNIFNSFKNTGSEPFSLSHNNVTSIVQDPAGFIWIGTAGGGINKLDKQKQTISYYREEDGLPSDVVNGLLVDKDGNLWISTNNGISKFNQQTTTFNNYTVNNGLQGNQGFVFYQSKQGEIFFGGSNGFNRFFPSLIEDDTTAPSVIFTDLRVFNKAVIVKKERQEKSSNYYLEKGIFATEEITLSYDQNLFSFEFTSLDFGRLKNTRYAYKLEGWDKEWIYTDHIHRIASYTNIPAGTYQLKVKAGYRQDIWSEKTSTIKINILPAWWLSFQMKVIYGLVTLIILGLIIYRLTIVPTRRGKKLEQLVKARTSEVEQKKAEIQRLLEKNTKFTQNISHSLKTPLTLILGPTERMINDKYSTIESLNRIKRNALRLQRNIEQLVSFSRLSGAQKVSKDIQNVSIIAEEIVIDFQEAFTQKKQVFKWKIESNLKIFGEIDATERILINLIENALKYNQAGALIWIRVNRMEENVRISVSDNGIGISSQDQRAIFDMGVRLEHALDQPGTGIGLTFVKEMVQRNNGTIEVISSHTQGACFNVLLPLVKIFEQDSTMENISANTKSMVANMVVLNRLRTNSNQDFSLSLQAERPTILIVDNDLEMRSYVKEAFAGNFACLEAKNGEEALNKAHLYSPDLIISDIMMPKKNGLEMLKELKATPSISHIPVILITAAGECFNEKQLLSTGAIHYFNKPFDEKKLQSSVYEAVNIQERISEQVEKYLISNQLIETAKFPTLSMSDINLLNKFAAHIHKEYCNQNFTNPIKVFSSEVYMEHRTLRRKLSTLLNGPPAILLRDLRLNKASELLTKQIKPNVVYERVGFSSLEYFGRCFKEKYATTPTDFRKNIITFEED